jgi:hypothetical protein
LEQKVIRAIVVAGYIVIVAIALGTELYARRSPGSIAPLREMLEHVMESRTTRVAIIAAWWWFGWHFAFSNTVQLQL